MPGGISEELELSTPEFKGLMHGSGDVSPRIRTSISRSGKEGEEEGVFESSKEPHVSFTEIRSGGGGVKTSITRETEKETSTGLRIKGPNIGITSSGQRDLEISRGNVERDGSIQISETNLSLRDNTKAGGSYFTIGGLGGVAASSENTSGFPHVKGSCKTDMRKGTPEVTISSVTSGFSSVTGNISSAGGGVTVPNSEKGQAVNTDVKSKGSRDEFEIQKITDRKSVV